MPERSADEAAAKLLALCRRKRLPESTIVHCEVADLELVAGELLAMRKRIPTLRGCKREDCQ